MLVPTDLPDPNEPSFIEEASKRISQAIEESRGNAFVLFTSYDMLEKCYEKCGARAALFVLEARAIFRGRC